MYHQVDERPQTTAVARALTVTTQQFGSEMAYLRAHKLRAVSVAEYLGALEEKRPTGDMVIVTFDDGYADQYTRAFGILERNRAHATFFITTGNVGKLNHLTWRDIGIMQRAGMSFGGHSVNHIDLAQLSPAQQSRQIDGCITALEAHLHSTPVAYAYPSGAFDRTTEALLASSPIELAFTTDPVFELHDDPQYEIPRIRVLRGMPLDRFAAAIATPARRFALDGLPLRQAQQLRAQPATPQS
jgi:peptidoglycan/xylan/chitin deacetylase (PgdA/CDA1 family)